MSVLLGPPKFLETALSGQDVTAAALGLAAPCFSNSPVSSGCLQWLCPPISCLSPVALPSYILPVSSGSVLISSGSYLLDLACLQWLCAPLPCLSPVALSFISSGSALLYLACLKWLCAPLACLSPVFPLTATHASH